MRSGVLNFSREGWRATQLPNSFPASNPARTRFTKRATLTIVYLLSSSRPARQQRPKRHDKQRHQAEHQPVQHHQRQHAPHGVVVDGVDVAYRRFAIFSSKEMDGRDQSQRQRRREEPPPRRYPTPQIHVDPRQQQRVDEEAERERRDLL